MIKAQLPASEDAFATLKTATVLTPAASLFHSLSDTTRLAIVRHLLHSECRVVDLTAHFGLAQSTVSAHLACLRDCGLVISRPQGRSSLFTTNPDAEAALYALLAAAEQLLAATGSAVELCPAYGSQGPNDHAVKAPKTLTQTTEESA